MNSLTSRQVWRRDRAATIRQERTITAYIKAKYPKIYGEAANFYNALNKRYPHKFDLRKLPEFHALCLDIPSKKSKYWTKEYPNIPEGSAFQDNMERTEEYPNITEDSGFQDNMELRIQLLPYNTVQGSEDTTTSTLQGSEDTTTLQGSEDTTTPTLQGSEVPEPAQFVQLGEIDHDTIDKIVADLQNDPDIYNFFEDIEVEQLSPLEAELLLY